MTTTTIPKDKTTQLRIEKALAKPGAQGKKGFLLWVEAAFPPEIVKKVLAAAAPHAPPTVAVRTVGAFGDVSTTDVVTLPDTIVTAPTTDATSAPSSAVTAATDSKPADPSWISSISSAIQAAGQAYLTKTQVDAANQIFQVNLQRARLGQSPIPIDPTQYGLPAPTARIGLTADTSKLVMWGGIGLLAVILLGGLAKGRR